MKLKKFNKAAMFGLDARIALAIFGALSVISGAALYSAIQQAKVTSIITEFNEIIKSLESYIVDTGSYPGLFTGQPFIIDPQELISSTKQGWRGPYTSHKAGQFGASTCTNCVLDGSFLPYVGTLPAVGFITLKNDSSKTRGLTECTGGTDCKIWLWMNYLSIEMVAALENKIDRDINYKEGKLRVMPSSNPKYLYIYLETNIHLEQVK